MNVSFCTEKEKMHVCIRNRKKWFVQTQAHDVCIDRVGVCVSIKISESSKITGQRLDAVEGISIYWQIETINQTDRSSDREQKLNGRILLLDR